MFVCVHVGVLFSAHRSLPRRVLRPPFDLLAVAVRALSFPKCRPTLVCSPPRSSSTRPNPSFPVLSFSASLPPLFFPSPARSVCSHPRYFISSCDSFLQFSPHNSPLFSPYLLFPPSAPSRSPSERLRIPKGADAIKMLILSVYREW